VLNNGDVLSPVGTGIVAADRKGSRHPGVGSRESEKVTGDPCLDREMTSLLDARTPTGLPASRMTFRVRRTSPPLRPLIVCRRRCTTNSSALAWRQIWQAEPSAHQRILNEGHFDFGLEIRIR